MRYGRALIAGAAAALVLAGSLAARAQTSPDTPSSPPPPPSNAPSPGFEQGPASPGANPPAPAPVPPTPPAPPLTAAAEAPPVAAPGYAGTAPAWSSDAAPVAPTPAYAGADTPAPPTGVENGSGASFSHGTQFVYFNVETGFEQVSLRSLHTDNLLPETVDSSASAPFFGVGGGLQFAVLTVGPRFRTASFDSWSVWTLDLEAKIHLPVGRIEPYFIFAGGYANLDPHAEGVKVHGYNARIGVGIDIYATKNFTIGASGTGELIGMSRSGNNLTTTPQAQAATCAAIADPVQKQQCATDALYAADGSALGIAGTLALVAGLHF